MVNYVEDLVKIVGEVMLEKILDEWLVLLEEVDLLFEKI